MTGGLKIALLAAAILGLAYGGYLGHRNVVEIGNSLKSIQYVAPTKVASDFTRTQFMHADTDHAGKAVIMQINLLEQLELADKSFHADELALAYIRLAMVVDAAGRPEAAQRALDQARLRYRQMHSRNAELTDDELKNLVKQSDRLMAGL